MGAKALPTHKHNNKEQNNNTLGGNLKDRSSLSVLSRLLKNRHHGRCLLCNLETGGEREF